MILYNFLRKESGKPFYLFSAVVTEKELQYYTVDQKDQDNTDEKTRFEQRGLVIDIFQWIEYDYQKEHYQCQKTGGNEGKSVKFQFYNVLMIKRKVKIFSELNNQFISNPL